MFDKFPFSIVPDGFGTSLISCIALLVFFCPFLFAAFCLIYLIFSGN